MKIFSILFLIVVSAYTFAHMDMNILLENNKLVRLPEEFQPATLNIQARTLVISGNKLVFPECFEHIWSMATENNLEILSSWYHSKSSLPPYISFIVNEDYENELLLDLSTLNPIKGVLGYGKDEAEINCLNKFTPIKN